MPPCGLSEPRLEELLLLSAQLLGAHIDIALRIILGVPACFGMPPWGAVCPQHQLLPGATLCGGERP